MPAVLPRDLIRRVDLVLLGKRAIVRHGLANWTGQLADLTQPLHGAILGVGYPVAIHRALHLVDDLGPRRVDERAR
eukprot:CAMPEP_0174727076 /NCGR_PEP_ID=MMETSP1094-20130205/49031_1 /TAXON_ID=156173 /ORGANISM="Chrysochromulina brevifilum, Strain UTEX LB 985" /LENGTH=75 /DNA_ID=CAMNT_0015928745 /DNA_START=140 /DNA_END=364 /DNA_ORIENTATION=+